MNYRDNNNNPYQIGHIYKMYSSQYEMLEFSTKGGAVLVRDIKEPKKDSFHFYVCEGWVHIGPARPKPKSNREAFFLLEKEEAL